MIPVLVAQPHSSAGRRSRLSRFRAGFMNTATTWFLIAVLVLGSLTATILDPPALVSEATGPQADPYGERSPSGDFAGATEDEVTR